MNTRMDPSLILRFRNFALLESQRSWLFHPLSLFIMVWIGVALLYSLHLSKLLLYTTTNVLKVVADLIIPFSLAGLIYLAMYHFSRFAFSNISQSDSLDLLLLTSRLNRLFIFWIVISILEITTSGGMPILWLLQGSAKTYMDFGIPTVHGFMNSLLLSIALINTALFAILKQRKYLLLPAFTLLWSILAITRNMMIVLVLEVALLLLQLISIRLVTLFKAAGGMMLLILAFGFIGDFRTGGEAFRILAQPTNNYPDWLPSGLLWAYIYLVTPINNLIHTILGTPPLYSALFPNTLASLLPTVLRNIVYGPTSGTLATGDLVTEAFNVSTAYAGPFQDYGLGGIILFSSAIGIVSMAFWKRTGLRDILIYTVLAQCIILTVFYDHFLALPIITQVFWLGLFFMPEVHFGSFGQRAS